MKKMKSQEWRTRWVALCAGAALGLSATAASAALIDVTLNNVPSIDYLGDPDNFILNVDLAAAAGLPSGSSVDVNGISWDVTIEAIDPSWLSEAAISVQDSSGTEVSPALIPGDGDDFSGPKSYTGVKPVTTFTLSDGLLRLEFFEVFPLNDYPGSADAFWNGTLTFRTVEQAVPAPATLLLLVAGLGGLWVRRRRAA